MVVYVLSWKNFNSDGYMTKCIALQRKSQICIPFLGIARPQPQFRHSCCCERFIYCSPRIGLPNSSSGIGRPIVGIYKSLTDTWMWKLELRSRYSFSGNICLDFGILSLQCGSSICVFFCFQQCEYQLALGNTILANLVKMYSKSGSLCTYTAILIYLAGGLCNCAERMWSNKHKPPALQGCRSHEHFRFYLQWINQFLTFTVLFENKTRYLLFFRHIFLNA